MCDMLNDSNGKKPKLLDQVRHTIRAKHYNIRTEEAYIDWIQGGGII